MTGTVTAEDSGNGGQDSCYRGSSIHGQVCTDHAPGQTCARRPPREPPQGRPPGRQHRIGHRNPASQHIPQHVTATGPPRTRAQAGPRTTVGGTGAPQSAARQAVRRQRPRDGHERGRAGHRTLPVDAFHARAPGTTRRCRPPRKNGDSPPNNIVSWPSPPATQTAPAAMSRGSSRDKPAPARNAAPPYLKLLVARETGQLPELQLNACHLGHRAVGGPSGRVSNSSADVDVGVRNLRGCLERRHQAISKVLLTQYSEESLTAAPQRPCLHVTRWPVTRFHPIKWKSMSLGPPGAPTPNGSRHRAGLQQRGKVLPQALTRTCAGTDSCASIGAGRWEQTPAPDPTSRARLWSTGHSQPSPGRGRPPTGGRRSGAPPGSESCSQTD